MFYTIVKTKTFELDLSKAESASLEGSAVAAFLHHEEGSLYYFEHNDEGYWDDDSIAVYIKKVKEPGFVRVLVMDECGAQDLWTFDFGPGYFEMRDE